MRAFRAQAWGVWLLAGGALVLATRNPLYLLLLLAISRIAQATCANGPAVVKGADGGQSYGGGLPSC